MTPAPPHRLPSFLARATAFVRATASALAIVPARAPLRAAAPAALVAALLVPALPAQAAAPAEGQSPVAGQACTEGDGVTVVVDLTDLGEQIQVGCAEGDPATGREALEQAGFTTTDSMPGMICAVNGLPDPCPEEFDGNYWAYFSAEANGEWTARTEGADTADPAPGTFEGWRYNDGSTGPGVEPAELTALLGAEDGAADDAQAAEDDGDAQAVEDGDAQAADDGDAQAVDEGQESGPAATTVVAVVVAVVAVLVAVGLLLRRRGGGQA